MFHEMYKEPGTKLDTLVIGHLEPTRLLIEDSHESGKEGFILPQLCSSRGQKRDFLGRTKTVGVPVTRAMLRCSHLYTSVLGLDSDLV